MVMQFDHTGIVVQDLEKITDFYVNTLGLVVQREVDAVAPPEGDHTGFPSARRTLRFVGIENNHRIELVKYHNPPGEDGYLRKNQHGAMHICFLVEDLQTTYDNLVAKGINFVTEPIFHDTPEGRRGIIYLQDPEGNWLEFIQPPK
ncbi:MAG: VOC family protein [Chloroflexi bacterium]|nr:VOC family protein [Chloroflexota bacterium]